MDKMTEIVTRFFIYGSFGAFLGAIGIKCNQWRFYVLVAFMIGAEFFGRIQN